MRWTSLDLPRGRVLASRGGERGGELQPHGGGLERRLARHEHLERVLERAARGLWVAAIGRGHRLGDQRGRPGASHRGVQVTPTRPVATRLLALLEAAR